MKTLTQILAAAVVAGVGAAGVAHADYTLSGGGIQDTGLSTVGSPAYIGNTIPTPITVSSVFDFTVGGNSPLVGPATLSLVENGIYEVGNGYASAGALASINSISLAPNGGGASAVTSVTPISWTLASAGNYEATVSWTVNAAYNGYPNYLSEFLLSYSANLNNGVPTFSSGSDALNAYVSAVPEPSQAIAGITLLGCGGLVFLGRRFVAKKA